MNKQFWTRTCQDELDSTERIWPVWVGVTRRALVTEAREQRTALGRLRCGKRSNDRKLVQDHRAGVR